MRCRRHFRRRCRFSSAAFQLCRMIRRLPPATMRRRRCRFSRALMYADDAAFQRFRVPLLMLPMIDARCNIRVSLSMIF